jgi:electron transport complex protein RnfB
MIFMDNPFILAIMAMGGLGILFSLFLSLAAWRFRVEENPLVEEANEILPQINCGACTVPGCRPFAEKVVAGELPITGCIPGGQDVADELSELLGVEAGMTKRNIAVLLCKGGRKEAPNVAEYYGDMTCEAAKLAGGGKGCVYGCVGYGDCVKSCEYDAMAMDDNTLPVIFYDKCIGCNDCIEACPYDLIELHPEDHKLFVYCKSKDKGQISKKVCTVSCIACNICAKDCPVEGAIEMIDELAVINYDKIVEGDEPTKRCPTKCIFNDIEKEMTSVNFYSKSLEEAV